MPVLFKPKPMPKAEDLPQAKDVDLVKKKTTASGEQRREPIVVAERKRDKEEIELAIDKMIQRGDVHIREKGTPVDTTDPELLGEFARLLQIGASRDDICQILKIPRDTYNKLKRRYLEGVVETLSETGVMGMVALSFDGLEMAKRRTLQLISTLDPQAKDSKDSTADLLNAIRTLKDIESEKINLLVKTGAIKVKKKTEISVQMEQLSPTSQPLLSGEKAQGTMVRLAAKLLEASEADDDGDTEAE